VSEYQSRYEPLRPKTYGSGSINSSSKVVAASSLLTHSFQTSRGATTNKENSEVMTNLNARHQNSQQKLQPSPGLPSQNRAPSVAAKRPSTIKQSHSSVFTSVNGRESKLAADAPIEHTNSDFIDNLKR
jgi:hypothetical protein